MLKIRRTRCSCYFNNNDKLPHDTAGTSTQHLKVGFWSSITPRLQEHRSFITLTIPFIIFIAFPFIMPIIFTIFITSIFVICQFPLLVLYASTLIHQKTSPYSQSFRQASQSLDRRLLDPLLLEVSGLKTPLYWRLF